MKLHLMIGSALMFVAITDAAMAIILIPKLKNLSDEQKKGAGAAAMGFAAITALVGALFLMEIIKLGGG